jgi:1,2-diacylglycerol 3-alpha-glucosyltransferase
MRVGLFTDTYPPQINGVASSVYLLKRHLELQGHEVFVCTTTDPEEDRLNEDNVYRTYSLPFVSKRRVGSFYSARLAMLAKEHKPDIIHTHTEFPLGIFGRRLAHEMNIPHVHTYHTIYEDYTHFIVKLGFMDTAAKAVMRYMSKTFCNSANAVVVPTKKVESLLRTYEVDRPIHVVPSGIDLSKFQGKTYKAEEIEACRIEVGLKPGSFVLLSIGRVSEEKRIDDLLLGLAPTLKRHPDWVFLVIGDGPDLESYKYLSEQLGISDKVIFAGARPWSEIGKYYQLGDVFLSASKSETQGLTYIEAMASSVPVIAQNDPCLEGVVEDGVNGFLFNSPREMTQILESLSTHPDLIEDLRRGALAGVEHFSADNFASRIAEVYEDVLEDFVPLAQDI